jgi:AcrR family transcriptional regulator
MTSSAPPNARERLIATAHDLFTLRGISDVGVDEVVAKAGVAKATLYKYFPSKEDLVLAFLAQREQLWTEDVIDRQPAECTDDPALQLLATFDGSTRGFAAGVTTRHRLSSKSCLKSGMRGASGRHALPS